MDYLIPAWHELLEDSAVMMPKLKFDDAYSNLHLLKDAHQAVGVIVTDYQPHLLTQLNSDAILPDKIISVFDILQGIHHFSTQVLTYDDFIWPRDAYLEFSPFHLNVYQGSRLYARVIFDENSRIIYVEYYHANGRDRLLVDSRGFISRKEEYDANNQELRRTYYDENGDWRFKHNLSTDSVQMNPENNDVTSSDHYDHLQNLIQEILQNQIFPQIISDDRLLVSLDDHSVVPQSIYLQYPTLFYASSWNDNAQVYQTICGDQRFKCVFDNPDLAKRLGAVRPVVISPFQTHFKLGHSQRQDRQRILLFTDNLEPNDLMELSEQVFQRLLRADGDDELYLLSYTRPGYDLSQQVIQMLQNNHADEFQLFDPDDDNAKEELVDEEEKVPLVIKAQQCTANVDVLKLLDKTRLLIDWGEKPDNYLMVACVSVGVPRIQRVNTPEVKDHQNGLIIPDINNIGDGLDYYLGSLKNWNQSLTYNVQVLNAHSSEHMLEKWQNAWEHFYGGADD